MTDYIKNYADSKSYYFHFYSVVSGEHVKFPALLTQLDDKFSPNWSSQKVFGRQDPIITFQGTERTIDVAFDVPSKSVNQAKDNLVKLNKLIKFLYPGFSTQGSANTISASPLLRIKFANLIYDQSSGSPAYDEESDEPNGLVCGINNFSHKFKFDGTAGWVDEENSAIPASFSVSFSAMILHTHDLGHIQGASRQPDSEFPYFVSAARQEEPVPGGSGTKPPQENTPESSDSAAGLPSDPRWDPHLSRHPQTRLPPGEITGIE
jgi:hypothetical protein